MRVSNEYIVYAVYSRVYAENIDGHEQKLYISRIEQGDAGVYSCRAVINDEDQWKNLTLVLFSKYWHGLQRTLAC